MDKVKLHQTAEYMCKPLVAPIIVSETDFVQQLLLMMKQLHFVDNVQPPEAMDEFANDHKFELIQTELDLINKIERYLQYVTQPNDIKRILTTFIAIFESLDEQLKTLKGRGFFIMPINRLFSYFITRVLMKAYIEQLPDGVDPALAA